VPVLFVLLLQAAAPAPVAKADVLVVGRRAERELAECLARACPPAEDVEQTLRAATEQFAGGRYADARRTLRAAIRRNGDHAADLAVPVSQLHATLAAVAEHEGDVRLWRNAGRNSMIVLRNGLGDVDPALLRQELVFADSMLGRGAPVAAERAFGGIQRRAVAAGQREIAAGAAVRRAWLALWERRFDDARRLADAAVAIAGPDSRSMADAGEIVRMHIAVRQGKPDAVDALAARLRSSATERPRLLFGPAIDVAALGQDARIRYADLGYWIRPDGRTAEAELLHDGGLKPVAPVLLRQIRARRYVPLDLEPADPGLYRIERFTVRAVRDVPPGSRALQRYGPPTVHVADLTETEAMRDDAARPSRP